MIEAREINGRTYYTTTRKGTEYCARKCFANGGWIVETRRLALGRNNFGSVKRFDNVADLSANVRAFAGLDKLLSI